jgi:hypothetical protein
MSVKESTRRDRDRFLDTAFSFHYPGSPTGYLPRTAAVWFWILASVGGFFLLAGVAAARPGIRNVGGLVVVVAAVVGLRWLLVSRHLPDDAQLSPR